MVSAGERFGLDSGQITWAGLLEGTVGALIGAALAVVVGLYAVHRTIAHEREQSLRRALLDRASALLAEGQKILPAKETDEDAMWATVLPLISASMALRMEVAGSRPSFSEWLQEETERLSRLGANVRDEQSRDKLISFVAKLMFAISLWGEAGLLDWSAEEVRAAIREGSDDSPAGA